MPILVDPARGRDWREYDGYTVIKANRIEDAEALVCDVGDSPAMMARRLAIRQGCHVVVTAGELGLWWSNGQKVRRVPAIPVQVRDVCGAGDTVFAMLAAAMTSGGTIEEGCRRAVRMAAEQVGQVGVGGRGNAVPADDRRRTCARLVHGPGPQGVVPEPDPLVGSGRSRPGGNPLPFRRPQRLLVQRDRRVVGASRRSDGCRSNRLRFAEPVQFPAVLFEDRRLAAKAGVWEDDFAPYAVHVYSW